MEPIQKFSRVNENFSEQVSSLDKNGLLKNTLISKNSILSIGEQSNDKGSGSCFTSFFQGIWKTITSIFHAIFSCGNNAEDTSDAEESSNLNTSNEELSEITPKSKEEVEGSESIGNSKKEEVFEEISSTENLTSEVSEEIIPESELESNLKEKNPELFRFYKKNGIFSDCSKEIKVDIETFNGLFGINLDEVYVDDYLKDRTRPTISLSPWLNNEEWDYSLDFQNLPKSITCREAIKYVIDRLNDDLKHAHQLTIGRSDFILESHLNSKEVLKNSIYIPERFTQLDRNPILSSIENMAYSRPDRVRDIKKIGPERYVSLFQVICQVLKEKKLIFGVFELHNGSKYIQC